jgi:hypothetical protein
VPNYFSLLTTLQSPFAEAAAPCPPAGTLLAPHVQNDGVSQSHAEQLSPEQVAQANETRDDKKKDKLLRQKSLEHARAAFAMTINDKEGWPTPLSIAAAEEIQAKAKKSSRGRAPSQPLLYVGQVFPTKNALLSRIMSYHEILKRRSHTADSRGLLLEQGCPFDGCNYKLTASFKAIPATQTGA